MKQWGWKKPLISLPVNGCASQSYAIYFLFFFGGQLAFSIPCKMKLFLKRDIKMFLKYLQLNRQDTIMEEAGRSPLR